MSICCGAECIALITFTRWIYKRCTHTGNDDSSSWPLTTSTSTPFSAVPRLSRLILAVYEPDLHNPIHPPPGGYDLNLNPNHLIKHVSYLETLGDEPPYLIYADHTSREIILAIRGLNLFKESDYKLLLDNRLGRQMFDGGYVHHGLLKSAISLLNKESETLKKLWIDTGSCYTMIFAGHSLGSGIAALLTILVVNHRDKLGGIPRNLVKCYSLAPARCMSLNLAVKYADVINSVILQDDFLPRTTTPLQDIFESIFCLPCLIFMICVRDTFVPEQRKLRDPRRLYAPGRMYHIVERKFCRCGRFPPEVRTAIPVDGRFEHIVLSCHATSDHGLIWIMREAEKALELIKAREGGGENGKGGGGGGGDGGGVTSPPRVQRIEKEHKEALERAVSLNVPHAVSAEAVEAAEAEEVAENEGGLKSSHNWNELVDKLLHEELTLKNGDVNDVQK
ncbi:uncharacterized protein LOC141646762 [Silene latifolia]|uniref:uncharacterized protein LOC141646762 n=1 Tax=Silene latifolia TaxID=37657 RepID=UPI003D77C8E6